MRVTFFRVCRYAAEKNGKDSPGSSLSFDPILRMPSSTRVLMVPSGEPVTAEISRWLRPWKKAI